MVMEENLVEGDKLNFLLKRKYFTDIDIMIFFHVLNIIGIILMIISLCISSALFCLSGILIILVSTNSIIYKNAKSYDIFSPLFVTTMIFIVSCSIGAILYYLNSIYSEDALNLALIYVVIFALSFILGFSSRIGNILSKNLPKLTPDFSLKRLRFVTISFLPVGIFLFIFLMRKAGFSNSLEILENLSLFRRFWSQQGYAYIMEFSLFFVQAPFWGWILIKDNPIKFNFSLGLYFILLLVISILTGARGPTLSLFLGLLFIYHCRYKRIGIFKMLFLIALFLIPISIFYMVSAVYRGTGGGLEKIISLAKEVNISEGIFALIRRFTVPVEGFADILLNSHNLNLLWGRSFHDALFMPIPRAFMPDKPYLFNTQMLWQIHPEFKGEFFGTTFSMMGEFYMNFHFAGIVIGGFIFGIIIKIMQVYYINNQSNISFLFLYRMLLLLPFAWFASGLINSEANISLLLGLFFAFIFFAFVWPKNYGICRRLK